MSLTLLPVCFHTDMVAAILSHLNVMLIVVFCGMTCAFSVRNLVSPESFGILVIPMALLCIVANYFSNSYHNDVTMGCGHFAHFWSLLPTWRVTKCKSLHLQV